MSILLKQSTVSVINFGPILDKTDGVTLEEGAGIITSLDHATTGIKLSKNGGTLTIREQGINFIATTYDAHGCYKVSLSAVDTGTLGRLRVIHTEPATYLAVWHDFMVVPANVYNSLILGSASDYLDVAVVEQANIDFGALQKTSLNAATPASVVGAVGSVTGAVASVTGAVGSVTGAVGSVTGAVGSVTAGVTVTTNNDKTGYGLSAAAVQAIWDALLTALTTAGSIGKKLADWVVGTIDTYTGNTKQTGDAFTRLGAPAGASVSADIAAVNAKTTNLPASPAAVGSQMDLVNAPNATALTAIAAAIWNALTSGMSTVGSIGKKLVDWVVGTIDTYTGNTKQTGDAFARLGAPAGVSISADVAAVKTDTAAILDDTGTSGVVIPQAQADKVWNSASRTLTSFGTLIADIFSYVVEGSLTFAQTIRIKLSALAGKSTGGGTATLTFRDIADLKARITATVDANGNRTAITRDGT